MQNKEFGPTKDNKIFRDLSPDEQEEYLKVLMDDPLIRADELIKEGERLIVEGDSNRASEFVEKAEKTYNSADKGNAKILGKLKRLKEALKAEKDEVMKINKDTQGKTKETL